MIRMALFDLQCTCMANHFLAIRLFAESFKYQMRERHVTIRLRPSQYRNGARIPMWSTSLLADSLFAMSIVCELSKDII